MNLRINGRIKASQVRVILEDGSELGVLSLIQALAFVASRKMDLVEIGPEFVPPICVAIDFGKYRYLLASAKENKRAPIKLDATKRDYLLPKGCKDLIDVLKLSAVKKAGQ
jgi:translation initiation factor IF-3